jgi:co-chaperonin GroES (HSP10)
MNVVQGKIIPLKDYILVTDMEFGMERTATGIIIQSLNGKLEGVKSRWGRVWAIGPEQKDVKIGEWVCMAHGRWTRGVKVEDDDGSEITIRRVDNNDILMVSDEKPNDVDIGRGM